MITIRRADERGETSFDWLTSYHTFSFADYYDPAVMGFGHLRVINEDIIKPARGFCQHAHKDMEIITYVVSGSLEHKDSLGNGSVIKPGEIQRMSAGTGIEHSEFNHSKSDPLHLLQIWILPDKTDITPSYEQKTIPKSMNQLILIGSMETKLNTVTIHQDVNLFVAYMTANHAISHSIRNGRRVWLQLIKGEIDVNGEHLSPGDGFGIRDKPKMTMKCLQDAEFLLFDLN